MLAHMDPSELEDMWKPLAYMVYQRQGKQNILNPDHHSYLHAEWARWGNRLLTSPAATFTAALGDTRNLITSVPTVHICTGTHSETRQS